jgi:tetratricopeptide (TPR) repeat protein
MKNIKLTKIGFFNPGRLDDEEIELSFISRIPIFNYLFKKIINETENSIPQHYLVIGQRGMGKTSLLLRIAVELRKKPYSERFIGLTFPEEQYNIDKLSKFWLNCLDALADALDKEKELELTKILDVEIDLISKNLPLENLKIYEIFEKWIKKIRRRPVLLVDNLNLIFDKISKEEQHQLRAVLMTKSAPIILGASATTIDDTIDYGAAFYDSFQIQYLKKLTFQETIEILQNLAKITGKVDFEQIIHNNKGRLGALYQLTGGTPRTISMLFPLVQDGFSSEIQTDLDALLDVVTPLYKARFEELPDQLQIVLDAIALNWEPINIEQLRNKTQLENGQLSPQLKRLLEVGWLQKLDAFEAKGSAYEVSERFFNIWYIMRRSSRRMKKELYCLSKFLESMFGEELEIMAQHRLVIENNSSEQIFLNLALADSIQNNELKEKLLDKSYNELVELCKSNPEILNNFSIPNEKIYHEVLKLIDKMIETFNSADYKVCLGIIDQILSFDPNAFIAYDIRYEINLKAQNFQEAINDLLITINLKEKIKKGNFPNTGDNLNLPSIQDQLAENYFALANAYRFLKEFNKSILAYKSALNTNNQNVIYWLYLGDMYQYDLNNFDEAEKSYLNAVKIQKDNPDIYLILGNLYQDLSFDFQKAETNYNKSLKLNSKNSKVWLSLGNLYSNKIEDLKKATEAYLQSININPKEPKAWNGLGNLYLKINDFKKAEKAYLEALLIDENYAYPISNLGYLYREFFGDFVKAEVYFLKAVKLNKNDYTSWLSLALMYQYDLNRYLESENAYLNAIAINNNDFTSWNGIGNLYHDFLKDYVKAEKAYEKAIQLNPNNLFAQYNLIFLYRDKLNNITKALNLFNSIPKSRDLQDSYFLNKALFAYYENNGGIARKYIEEALKIIENELPAHTQDDWRRFAAITYKLGFARQYLDILKNYGYDLVLKPYFVAIEALLQKKPILFFNSIAAEVREPAKKIYEIMRGYL